MSKILSHVHTRETVLHRCGGNITAKKVMWVFEAIGSISNWLASSKPHGSRFLCFLLPSQADGPSRASSDTEEPADGWLDRVPDREYDCDEDAQFFGSPESIPNSSAVWWSMWWANYPKSALIVTQSRNSTPVLFGTIAHQHALSTFHWDTPFPLSRAATLFSNLGSATTTLLMFYMQISEWCHQPCPQRWSMVD